ncbi:MAG: chromosomal replication initiator protein DnaA [Proteobacteria bacterium]|nr:chromosomal replication initiator protein DnaA [Pseudomonadota bacterium]
MIELWKKFLEQSKNFFDSSTFDIWIEPMGILSYEEDTIKLSTPNDFFRDWINENYLTTIEGIFSSLLEKPVKVIVSTEKSNIKEPGEKKLHPSLISRYTFENFITGPSNEFAHAASNAVVNNLGNQYNPLLIYSNVGLGKTHLIMAIGHAVYQKYEGINILYCPSQKFVNDFISAIRFQRMNEFRERFKNVDILLLDDVQFIAGKEANQEEFFTIFNNLYEKKKQIVITSDKYPKLIQNIDDRLRNRFEWGLVVDIQPPEYETRVAIIKSKTAYHNVTLPDEIIHFIATNINKNIREMEGALTKLLAYSSLTKKKLNLNLTKEILADHLPKENHVITVESIQKATCDCFQLKISDIKSQKKLKKISIARHIAIYLSRKYTELSLNEIGNKFGGKDHSTVIHSINKVSKKIEEDESFKKQVEYIENLLKKY